MKFCWVTLHVAEMDRSLKFYQELLGLTLLRRLKPIPDRELAFLSSTDEAGATQIELVCNTPTEEFDGSVGDNASTRAPDYGHDISLGFEVGSLDSFQETLDALGIPVVDGPYQPNPMIRFMYILDPDGARIQLVENLT